MGLRLHQFLKTIYASAVRGLVLLQERFGYYIALLPSIGKFKSSKPMTLNVISCAANFFCLHITLEMLIFEEHYIFLHERFMVSMVYFSVLVLSKLPLASQ